MAESTSSDQRVRTPDIRGEKPPSVHDVDWVIVGSGFGGSVPALRLAEKGYDVLVLVRMLDIEVEVNSRLARLRLWNRLKRDQRRPVRTAVPSFQRDVRPAGRRWPARVAQAALPERGQQ